MFTRKLLQGVFGLAAGAVVAGGIGFSGAAHASPVYDTSVGMDNLTGTRVLHAEELETDGGTKKTDLTSLTLTWNIAFDTTLGVALPWSYSYTLAWTPDDANSISHMILNLSDNCTATSSCVQNAKINGSSSNIKEMDYKNFSGADAGNPGMGGLFYGVKFDLANNAAGATPFTLTFDSDRAPVWGDFYTKAGNPDGVSGWYSQNVGIDQHATSTNILNFIARPDTVGEMPPGGPGGPGIDVPEPMSMAVLGVGLIGLAAARRRRNSLS